MTTPWDQALEALAGIQAQLSALRSALEAARGSSSSEPMPWLTPEQAAERLSMSRRALDELVAKVPPDLPGAPVVVGDGPKRQHLRWDPRTLDEWRREAERWLLEEGQRPKATRRRRRKSSSSSSGRRRGGSLLAQVREG